MFKASCKKVRSDIKGGNRFRRHQSGLNLALFIKPGL